MMFQNRQDAGRQLAERLTHYRNESPLVLAIPRGGVPIGYEIARKLNAPLDVLVVRKLGAPGNPERGIGAIGSGGVCVLDRDATNYLGVTDAQLDQILATEHAELERRIHRFRGDRPLPNVQDRTVIVVDDGLATGVTAQAAIEILRRQCPQKIVLAVPVAPAETVEAFRSEVDDLVCLYTPYDLQAIGRWYVTFEQLSDEEVLTWLERAKQEREAPARSEPEAAQIA